MFDRQQDLKTIRRCKRGEEDAFVSLMSEFDPELLSEEGEE